jgi:hypothetical protein
MVAWILFAFTSVISFIFVMMYATETSMSKYYKERKQYWFDQYVLMRKNHFETMKRNRELTDEIFRLSEERHASLKKDIYFSVLIANSRHEKEIELNNLRKLVESLQGKV